MVKLRHRSSYLLPLWAGLLTSVLLQCLDGATSAATPESKEQRDRRMAWFREARFGMFIHWGLYAVPAGEWNGKAVDGIGEWIMNNGHIPVAEYEKLAERFNPVKFNAAAWVQAAKAAGIRYLVITSKHHDGFSMFDSRVSEYTIVKSTPFQRDPMKELAAACKQAGIRFCFYYSIMDWHHPDAQRIGYPNYNNAPSNPYFPRYVQYYLKPQLKELLTNYGPLGILWFDGEWIGDWKAEMGRDLYGWCRAQQPDLIINNRIGKARNSMQGMNLGEGAVGDYGTPEQEIPPTGFGAGIDWESCMTMNDTWGFKKNDNQWKSTATIVDMLIDCASKGGNFLLNVGPTAEGEIPGPSLERLAEVGKWMEVNHEAIYGSTASPFKRLVWGKCTQKPGKLYLLVEKWPSDGKLLVPVKNRVTKAYLLSEPGKALDTAPKDDGIQVSVPSAAADPIATVIVAEIEGAATAL